MSSLYQFPPPKKKLVLNFLQDLAVSISLQNWENVESPKSLKQRMRLQRRLYKIHTVCSITFIIPAYRKLVMFKKSYFIFTNRHCSIQGRRINLYWSSWKSHPLWVTLYKNCFMYFFWRFLLFLHSYKNIKLSIKE